MPAQLPMSHYQFPNPLEHDIDGNGLICIGADLKPETLYEAYCSGLFPWFNEDDPICWWSPDPRCIIYPSDYRPSKSLLRNMKKYDYTITVNRAFEQVMRACAAPRQYTQDTWISDDIIQGYTGLFKAGYAYSIEVWDDQALVGGLYGTTIGGACFGESMFSTRTDVSKMAFYTLMLLCQEQHCPWVDCQLVNDHLLSLGATTMSRTQFLSELKIMTNAKDIDWHPYQNSILSSKEVALYNKLL